MTPYYDDGQVVMYHGDCREILPALDPVDAIVTDPPYELGFMGKAWDRAGVAFEVATWAKALDALKPGGHLLAMGGTRTHHRLMVAIEDAGFEIRDCLMWLYGTGFPKSHNLGNGWGTALKPAYEPIIMARKPLIGTVAANVAEYGTGAINIDDCRIGTESTLVKRPPNSLGRMNDDGWQPKPGFNGSEFGRWPANLVLDEDAAALLDQVVGTLNTHGGGVAPKTATANVFGTYGETSRDPRFQGDAGGPSRFFYTAKASRRERGEGNDHPTVKPLALMRYLCRLITPPGGVVLDPFLGSGSTAIAARSEGFRAVGIEQDAHYIDIAVQRLQQAVLPLEVPA